MKEKKVPFVVPYPLGRLKLPKDWKYTSWADVKLDFTGKDWYETKIVKPKLLLPSGEKIKNCE